MKQIDLEPDDYRKQDPKTGDWVRNVDKKDARRWGIITLAGSMMFIGKALLDGNHDFAIAVVVGTIFGFAAGGLITLSLNRLDW